MTGARKVSFEQLVDWIEGRLSDAEATAVARLVETADEAVRDDVAWLRAFLDTSAKLRMESPPPDIHQTLVRRFAAHARTRRLEELKQWLVGALTFDSARTAALGGVRATSLQGPPRQIVYSTDPLDVALALVPDTDGPHLTIHGQILPKTTTIEPSGFSVQLQRDATEIARVDADDLGEFVFDRLDVGTYEIILANEQYSILLAPIDLQR
jgi:hypothetical protein